MNLDLDEQTWILLLVGAPIPFLAYLIKTEFTAFLFVLMFYFGVNVVGPVLLQAREQAVYRKAQVICWLKMAGTSNFTPAEQEILNKAIGKESKKPVRKAVHPLLKHWKPIFLAAVLTSSILVWIFVPAPPVVAATEYAEAYFIDVSVNPYPVTFANETIQPRRLLYATLALNISERNKVFLSSIEAYNSTGHLIGKDYYGTHWSDYSKGVFVEIQLQYSLPVNATVTLKAIFTDQTTTWEGQVP